MPQARPTDLWYVTEAREISNDIRRLFQYSTDMQTLESGDASLGSQLRGAKALALETRRKLREFAAFASEAAQDEGERMVRLQEHQRLKSRYLHALKALDVAAQKALMTTARDSSAAPSSGNPHFAPSELRPHSREYQLQRSQNQDSNAPRPPDRRHLNVQESLKAGTVLSHRSDAPREERTALLDGVDMVEIYKPPTKVLDESLTENSATRQWQQEALNIQKDITRISQLYQDVAWHVSNDARDLNRLEAQLDSAADVSLSVTEDLSAAAIQVRRSRRWMLVVGVLGGVGLLVNVVTAFL